MQQGSVGEHEPHAAAVGRRDLDVGDPVDRDDDTAAAAAQLLISAAGFEAVKVGGVAAALRIEVFGDLHENGGLDGRLLDRAEAEAAVATVTV